MEKKKGWLKGIAVMLVLTLALSSFAAPMPAQAAVKKTGMEVKVASPKNVKLQGMTLKLHTKKPVQLKVKYNGKDVTNKVKYKVTNPGVVSVNKKGRITVKTNGIACITFRYKGMSRGLKLIVYRDAFKAGTEIM